MAEEDTGWQLGDREDGRDAMEPWTGMPELTILKNWLFPLMIRIRLGVLGRVAMAGKIRRSGS